MPSDGGGTAEEKQTIINNLAKTLVVDLVLIGEKTGLRQGQGDIGPIPQSGNPPAPFYSTEDPDQVEEIKKIRDEIDK